MSTHRRQGVALVAGAAAVALLVGEPGDPDTPLGFHWLPLLLGLAYLAAAALGGKHGSYWATAVVLTAFGLGPVAFFELEPDITQAATYVVALGAGVLIASRLAARGTGITQDAVGATILALGVVYALQPHVGLVEDPTAYAAALAIVGLVRAARPTPA